MEEELTVGIGVICENGDAVLIGSDMRATFPKLPTKHEECGKLWELPKPFDCGVAAELRVAEHQKQLREQQAKTKESDKVLLAGVGERCVAPGSERHGAV
jgi:hypothetical protein